MAEQALRHSYNLLEADAACLDARGLSWETIYDANAKWILIKGFPIPVGYNASEAEIALLLPDSYPTVQFDMVYVTPPLELANGATMAQLSTETHDGRIFQRWSRHRTPENPWRPDIDDLASHLSLVEEWFLKETKRNA